MPVRTRSSDDLDFLLVELDGVVSTEELEQEAAPLLARPKYGLMRRMLVDTSGVTKVAGPSAFFRGLARRVEASIDHRVGKGSQLAVVATTPEFFGLARMYQTLRDGSPVDVEIFPTRGEAETWLELPGDYRECLTEVVETVQ